jgi:hypothetical protein
MAQAELLESVHCGLLCEELYTESK